MRQIGAGNQFNDLVAAYCKTERGLTYIDTRNLTLDSNGKVRPDVFVADMLHFNEEGYKLLIAQVRPYVPKSKK